MLWMDKNLTAVLCDVMKAKKHVERKDTEIMKPDGEHTAIVLKS